MLLRGADEGTIARACHEAGVDFPLRGEPCCVATPAAQWDVASTAAVLLGMRGAGVQRMPRKGGDHQYCGKSVGRGSQLRP